jgi:hypothetical protein
MVDVDIREFIEERILRDGLGINDATTNEIDQLISSRSSELFSSYTLAEIISRRAQIGVNIHLFTVLIIVDNTRSYCRGCEHICFRRTCDLKITWKS